MYEPHNHTRKIVAFDTFEGLKGTLEVKDGKASYAKDGAYKVTEGYEHYLNEIFNFHQSQSPLSHMKKFEIIKGDAKEELPKFLKNNSHTLIALAYFDMDLYEPTKECLRIVLTKMAKGGIIGFDELNHPGWPGETIALAEVMGFKNIKLERMPYSPFTSFLVL